MANLTVVMQHVERLRLIPGFPDVSSHVMLFLAETLIEHCPDRVFEDQVWTTEMQTNLATAEYISEPKWLGPGYMWNQYGPLWEKFERAEEERQEAEMRQAHKEAEESRRRQSQERYDRLLQGER